MKYINHILYIFIELVFSIWKNTYLLIVFFSNLVKYNLHTDEKPFLPFLEVWVGTKCNLKCKYCAHLIPYYKEKTSYDIEEVINDIRIMSNIANIKELSIAGGEPFTHPRLCELLEFILNNDDIKKVKIATNLTVIPNSKILDLMLKLKDKKNFYIRGSEYIGQEHRQEKLLKIFQQYNFTLELPFHEEKTWGWVYIPEERNKTNIFRGIKSFQKCDYGCHTICQGRFCYCMRGICVIDIFKTKYNLFEGIKIREIKNKPLLKAFISTTINSKFMKDYCKYCKDKMGTLLPGKDQLN